MSNENFISREQVFIEKINQQIDQEIRFDIDTLHESNFKKIVKYYDTISLAPIEYLIGGVLAALSGVIGKRVYLESRKIDRIYPNLFIVLIGRSTIMKKSSAINLCTEGLTEIEDILYQEYQKELNNYKNENSNKNAINSNDNSRPSRNYLLIPQNATVESLIEILSTSKQGLLIHHEFGAFLEQFNKSYQSGGKQFFTHIYDVPRRYELSRITREGKIVYRPYLSILGASTIDWMREFTSETDIKSGFSARFLYIIRNVNDKEYIPLFENKNIQIDKDFERYIKEILKYLVELPDDIKANFDDKAQKKYDEYDIESYKELSFCEQDSEVSFKDRLRKSVLKFAMLISLSDKKVYDRNLLVELKDVEDAINLAENLFKPNIEKLLNKELKSNELIRKEEKIIRALKLKGGNISRSDLMNTTGFSAKELDEIILNLEQKEKITTEQKINPKNKKRRIFYSLIS